MGSLFYCTGTLPCIEVKDGCQTWIFWCLTTKSDKTKTKKKRKKNWQVSLARWNESFLGSFSQIASEKAQRISTSQYTTQEIWHITK